MITLAIYFVIYLIVVLIPYFFLSDVFKGLFGIEFPQPSMGLLFLSFLFFPIIIKLLKISFKILAAAITFLFAGFISILTFPLKEDNVKTSEVMEIKEDEMPIEIRDSVLE